MKNKYRFFITKDHNPLRSPGYVWKAGDGFVMAIDRESSEEHNSIYNLQEILNNSNFKEISDAEVALLLL